MDCLEGMKFISDKSVDMIFTDLPYEQTQNDWDEIIPFEPLWEQYNRIIKDRGAIVLFGNGLFTAKLIMSNPKMWRYNLVWEKTTPTGHLNAKKMFLRKHEDICVFYKKLPVYNPQKTTGHKPVNSYTKHQDDGSNYGKTKVGISGGGSTERYPTSILKFATDKQKCALHPTQKPLALCEYLIKTYSNEGDLVLGSCAGSGTILLAAKKLGRNYIGFEREKEYFDIAKERICGL